MPRIDSITSHALRLPPATPWEDATNRVDALEFVIVEIACDDGTSGTGFTYSVDVGGSAIQALIDDYLAPLVVGSPIDEPQRIWQVMHRKTRRLGLGLNRLAMAGVDIAIWDARSRHGGQPLHRLLGAHREGLPAYISEIDLSPGDTVEQLARRAAGYRADGFRDMKIKVGDDLDRDRERIRAVADVFGGPQHVLVDVNQGWDAGSARTAVAALDELGVGWVEEPLPFGEIDAHRDLRRAGRTKIALGESLFSREQFLAYLRADAVDIVQADVAFAGGITPWLEIASLADAFGKKVAPHYLAEISLPLLCAIPNALMLECVVGGGFSELGLTTAPLAVADGYAAASTAPGIGFDFDRAAFSASALDTDRLRSSFRGGSK